MLRGSEASDLSYVMNIKRLSIAVTCLLLSACCGIPDLPGPIGIPGI